MHDEEFEEDAEKSRSQVKREMQALHDFGRELTKLKQSELAAVEMPEELREAILSAQKINSNSALKRQILYIAKILRKSDHEPIVASYDNLKQQQHLLVQQHHTIEHWRDLLLSGEKDKVTEFVSDFPHCNRQALRQILREALSAKNHDKKVAASRQLFKLIRETIQAHNDGEH